MEINKIDNLLRNNTLISEEQLTDALECSPTVLRKYRRQKVNQLSFLKFGRKVFYTRMGLIQYIVNSRVGISQQKRNEEIKNLENEYKLRSNGQN